MKQPLLTAVESVLISAALGQEPTLTPTALATIRELRRRLLTTRERRQESPVGLTGLAEGAKAQDRRPGGPEWQG